MNAIQHRMIGHATIIIMIALLAGFGIVMSLIGGFEVVPSVILEFDIPGDPSAWARAHVGGLLNGIFVAVIALVTAAQNIPEKLSKQLFWMLVGTGYANTIFYWGSLVASNRALSFGDNRIGETGVMAVIALLPAFVFAFVTLYAMILLARHSFITAKELK